MPHAVHTRAHTRPQPDGKLLKMLLQEVGDIKGLTELPSDVIKGVRAFVHARASESISTARGANAL